METKAFKFKHLFTLIGNLTLGQSWGDLLAIAKWLFNRDINSPYELSLAYGVLKKLNPEWFQTLSMQIQEIKKELPADITVGELEKLALLLDKAPDVELPRLTDTYSADELYFPTVLEI